MPITTIEECLNHDLLAYVSYPPNPSETVCFLFPRYVVGRASFTRIDSAVFPDAGSLLGLIARPDNAESLEGKCGSVVVARLNGDSVEVNSQYRPGGNPNKYCGRINLGMSAGRSQLEVRSLRKDALSKQLVQVIEVSSLPPMDGPRVDARSLGIREEALTEFVALECGRAIVGPFGCKPDADGSIAQLFGAEGFDYRVYEFPRSLADSVRGLADRQGVSAFRFLDRSDLDRQLSRKGYNKSYDWVLASCSSR